jgi:CRISPR-associated protein Cas1
MQELHLLYFLRQAVVMMSARDFTMKQIAFVIVMQGDCISFLNDNLVVRDKDKNIKLQMTCYQLFALIVVGNFTMTSGILSRAKKFGFAIVLMNSNYRVYSIIENGAEGNVLLRRRQYAYSSMEIGARVISNKINNQRSQLMRIRDKDEELKETLELLKIYSQDVLKEGLSCQEIMGKEGAASKAYFSQMFNGMDWTARRPRVKHDTTNCLLDIGYTILFDLVDALLNLYGFDVYVGVLHREFYQRKSLTCDIVEPFRPIVDYAIRKANNLGMIHEEDFQFSQKQYFLFGKKAVPYIRFLAEAMLSNKEGLFLYVQQYYRAFIRNVPIGQYPIYDIRGETC